MKKTSLLLCTRTHYSHSHSHTSTCKNSFCSDRFCSVTITRSSRYPILELPVFATRSRNFNMRSHACVAYNIGIIYTYYTFVFFIKLQMAVFFLYIVFVICNPVRTFASREHYIDFRYYMFFSPPSSIFIFRVYYKYRLGFSE